MYSSLAMASFTVNTETQFGQINAIEIVEIRYGQCLQGDLENDEVENPAEVEQTLLTFDLAAADLKKYYEELSKEYAGLPSYDRLIEAVS